MKLGSNVALPSDQIHRTLIDARTAEMWRTLTHRAVRRLGANDLGYTDPAGLAELHGNICDYQRATRAARCEAEQIVITAGTQQAAAALVASSGPA